MPAKVNNAGKLFDWQSPENQTMTNRRKLPRATIL
jgi:hypothetical protein